MADGRVIADVLMARDGIYEYPDPKYPGGIRRELRETNDVFAPKSMASYRNMPATPCHPPKLLDITTAKAWMIGATDGAVSRYRADDGHEYVRTEVMVTDAKTIERLDAGDTEVSMGYACLVLPESGTHPRFGVYHVRQAEIIGNHLAVAIGKGRAGRIARVRMDSELTSDERDKLANKSFADPKTHQEPIENAAHVRAAMARFSSTKFPSPAERKTAFDKIVSAAKKFGVDSSGFQKKYGARMDDADWDGDDDNGMPELVVMTTEVAGHQHTLDPADPSGCTSYAMSDGEDVSHRHEFVRGVDGTITIAANSGHTHEIDNATLGVRGDQASKRGGARAVPGAVVAPPARFDARGGSNMAENENEKERLQDSLKALEQKLRASELETGEHRMRADTAEKQRDMIQGRLDQVEKELGEKNVIIASGAQAAETAAIKERQDQLDVLQQKVDRFDQTFESRVRQRTALMFAAGSVLGASYRMDDLTDRQVMCAVVKRLDSSADVGDRVSEGHIAGQYEQLMKRRVNRARQEASIVEALGTESQQARTDEREKRNKTNKDRLWKTPLRELLGSKKEAR
jgi:hypothetical protein